MSRKHFIGAKCNSSTVVPEEPTSRHLTIVKVWDLRYKNTHHRLDVSTHEGHFIPNTLAFTVISLSLSLSLFFFLVRPRLFREARLNAGLAVNTLFASSMNTKRTARLGWLETRRDSTDSFIEESSLGGNELCLKRPLVQRSSGTDARHVPVLTSVLSHSSFIVEFREILSPPPARYYALSASISSFRHELHVSWHAKLTMSCAQTLFCRFWST